MNISRPLQLGLSVLELMISVAISAAMLSSLVYVYVGSRAAYRGNEALARVQENGRFALEWIARDLRQAGYMGCLSRVVEPDVRSVPRPELLRALYGFESSVADNVSRFDGNSDPLRNTTQIARERGDVLLFSSLDLSANAYVFDHTGTTITLRNGSTRFRAGDTLVVSDCQRAVLFTVTEAPITANPPTVAHRAEVNGVPVNDPANIAPFSAGSRVARIGGSSGTFSGYFIGSRKLSGTSIKGAPTLYRFNGPRTEAVAENIEDLDVLYGVDNWPDGCADPGPSDGVVDAYLRADEVGSCWHRVLAVRVSLVAVSSDAVAPPGSPSQTLYLRDDPSKGDMVVDAQTAPSDRRLRQVFSTTVALRNRLQ